MIKFGPAGNDILFYEKGYKDSVSAPEFLHSIGLNAYEYPCGRGILIKEGKAKEIALEAKKFDISISVHAPYFINFASPEQIQIEKSFKYVLDSLKLVKNFGGNRIVVHTGSNGKQTREQALNNAKNSLKQMAQLIHENGFDDCFVCLETMGKYTQIGNYKEIVDLCKIDKVYIPTFDFGHINCTMQGALKAKDDFKNILQYAINELGYEKIKNVHIHFSQIEFSEKGELKHLILDNGKFGPDFAPLAQALLELKIEPVIICESKDIMAQDALKLKNIYQNACKN